MEAVDIRLLLTLPIVMTILVVSIFLLLVPVIRVLRRTGYHPLWGLFAIFPGLTKISSLFGFSRSSHGPRTNNEHLKSKVSW